ncbi:MAG: type II secretion system F family protein [Candidatus Nanohaloarchaea archaeon]|nr:type II secretion system F family protein [Candidatus Nanohaloarchaea archaeon]
MFDDLSPEKKVEYASFSGGGLLQILGIATYLFAGAGMRPIGAALFLAGLIVAFLPYGIYVYFRRKKYSAMEKEFPSFLRNLSEARKSGMSLPQAFQNASETDYGRLNEDIRKAANQLSWGIPFPEVMRRFQRRASGSDLIKRSISIILQAYESGGDISQTMDSIASDAAKIKEAEKERKSVLTQQVFIIYVIYFLFAGIMIALYFILTPLLDIGQAGGSGIIQPPPNFCTESLASPICQLCPLLGMNSPATAKICYYKAIFLLMLMVEGVFNGLVAGEIRSGSVAAGVKHVMLMVPIGFVLYIGVMAFFG